MQYIDNSFNKKFLRKRWRCWFTILACGSAFIFQTTNGYFTEQLAKGGSEMLLGLLGLICLPGFVISGFLTLISSNTWIRSISLGDDAISLQLFFGKECKLEPASIIGFESLSPGLIKSLCLFDSKEKVYELFLKDGSKYILTDKLSSFEELKGMLNEIVKVNQYGEVVS